MSQRFRKHTRFGWTGGSVAGYTAGMVFHPESKIGVVIFRNYNRGKTSLGRSIRDLLKELVSAKTSQWRQKRLPEIKEDTLNIIGLFV